MILCFQLISVYLSQHIGANYLSVKSLATKTAKFNKQKENFLILLISFDVTTNVKLINKIPSN